MMNEAEALAAPLSVAWTVTDLYPSVAIGTTKVPVNVPALAIVSGFGRTVEKISIPPMVSAVTVAAPPPVNPTPDIVTVRLPAPDVGLRVSVGILPLLWIR
jgi:hypothetical protein